MDVGSVVCILFLLLGARVLSQSEDEVACGLTRPQRDSLLDTDSRRWTLDDAALTQHDLQDILDCAQEGDVLLLQTRETVIPAAPLQVRRGVSIRGPSDADDREISNRALVSCPSNQGLLVIRGVNFELQGVDVVECILSEDSPSPGILSTESCTDAASIVLTDVDFVDNAHFGGSIGLTVASPSCYTVVMTRVTLRSNSYAAGARLSLINTLRDIRLENNTLLGEDNDPLLLLPTDSNTTGTGWRVAENFGTMIRAENATVDISDAVVRNNAVNGSGVFQFVDTDLFLSSSRFEDNTCRDRGGAVSLEGVDGELSKTTFRRNAAANGGALYLSRPRRMRFDETRLRGNVADSIGGAFCIDGGSFETSIDIAHSIFSSNRASDGGGGISVRFSDDVVLRIDDTRFEDNGGTEENKGDGGALLFRESKNLTFSMFSSVLDGNNGLIGGGAYFDDVSGIIYFSDVRISNNRAKSLGGGMSIWNAGDTVMNTTMQSTIFESNSAEEDYGGALHGSGKVTEFSFLTSTFRGNEAPSGGAAYFSNVLEASFENCRFKENKAKGDGGGVWAFDVELVILIDSHFVRNRALSGGGVHLFQSEGLFLQSQFRGNVATRNGGGVMLVGEGGFAGFQNSSFVENRASIGGAVCSNEFESVVFETGSRFHRNEGELYGGGVFVAATRGVLTIEMADVSFIRNRASVGGGAAFYVEGRRRKRKTSSEQTVQLQNVVFERNFADLAGGGYFIDDPEELDTDCPLPDFAEVPEGRGFYASRYRCLSLLHNRAGLDGYGHNIATASFSYTTTLIYLNRTRMGIEPKENVFIPHWRPGELLPIIEIVMIDAFRQGPAPRHPIDIRKLGRRVNRLPSTRGNIFARLVSPEDENKLIPNQLSTQVTTGRGQITVGIPLKTPGSYSMILSIENQQSTGITFNVTIRKCGIDEESKVDGTLCLSCNTNTFNLVPGSDHCTACPDHCNCTHWGVAPKPKYWIPSPCHPTPLECLSEDACKDDRREEKLVKFFSKYAPSCDLEPERLRDFNAQQCTEGYEGLLCGSCSDGYGQFAMSCYKCLPMALVIVYLFGTVAYILIACSAVSVGNLTDIENSMTPGTIPASPPPSGTSSSVSPGLVALAVAQRNVTETVKLFLNFAQVNAIALTIDADWTSIMSRALQSLSFVGAVAVETPISLDCLFSKDASMPRSVKRTMVTLLMPFVVLFVLSIYWIVRLHHELIILKRRLILSFAIVFYISYIGWVEQLAAVLHCVDISSGMTGDTQHRLYWSEDTAVVCYEDSHAILLSIFVVPMLIIVVLAFPISSAIYLYLKRRKGELTGLAVREAFGFMYIAYRDGCVYWECVTLLRKAALALVIVFGASLGSRMQGLTAVCILVFSLYLQTRLLPFREDFPTLNRLEIFSLLVSNFTFISGLYLSDTTIGERGRMMVSILAVLLIFSFVAFFLYVVWKKALTFMRLTLEVNGQTVEGESSIGICLKWMHHGLRRISTLPLV